MTLMERARHEQTTAEVRAVAKTERIPVAELLRDIAAGVVVITKNNRRRIAKPFGIGPGLSTKVNANIGTSPDHISLADERKKLDAAVRAGADAVMDLSTGGNLRKIRQMILENCPVPVGTVPLYQTACETVGRKKNITQMSGEHMFAVIEEQAEQGVDFMTVHCGITRQTVDVLGRQNRLVGVVSRGGSFLVKWIKANNKENPLYEDYDRLLAIAKKYDVTLSLGDGFRPGCSKDASDGAQIAELSVLGELVLRARAAGVQTMIEGPGHVPLDQIPANVLMAKRLGHNAPLYFLGPIVTDIAPGYDHITAAIGGALAASHGVDFLCYVTPAEHLRLPDVDDVHNGVMAARIAGHAADIAKKLPRARDWDDEMSKWRKARDWQRQEKLSMDPVRFAQVRKQMPSKTDDVCAMCGPFCAMKD
ncbi:MAG: phosphomethylpyrimidine synthase ThiC [Elusimicrobia bacterium]|nr:phosphomethylpyrimidine synthase ThiC [Elusimicrobiota bacterium]